MQSDRFELNESQQSRIDCLNEDLDRAVKRFELIKERLEAKTNLIKILEIRTAQLEQANLDHITERQAWITEKAELLQQLETKRNMYNLMDELKHVAGLLSTTLAEERACKRARGDD